MRRTSSPGWYRRPSPASVPRAGHDALVVAVQQAVELARHEQLQPAERRLARCELGGCRHEAAAVPVIPGSRGITGAAGVSGTMSASSAGERLAQGARDIQELLSKHGFIPGVAGHAAHGNLHFTLVADFGDPEGQKRYAAFMTELVDLVVRKHDGSLKAEHGTGLNMAPFVESEWGPKATAMMWRIKELADPEGILGPNVILTRNAKLHLENLKSVPQIEGVTGSSQCIECGFCEPVCPSRNVTMTPRQRIVLRREMARQSPGSSMLARLQDEYQYDGIDTCAGDGTCAIPCPIGINTGALIRELRAAETTPTADKVALRLAKNWSTVEKVSRASLSATHAFSVLFGDKPLTALTGVARAVANPDLIPSVPGPMPRAARAPRSTESVVQPPHTFPPASTGCLAAIRTVRPRRPCRRRSSHYPNELVSRCGSRLTSPVSVAPRRGSQKAIPKATSSWPNPSPTPCYGGATAARSHRRRCGIVHSRSQPRYCVTTRRRDQGQIREPDHHRLDRVVSRPPSEIDDQAEARADRRAPNLLHHALGIGWGTQADRDAFGR